LIIIADKNSKIKAFLKKYFYFLQHVNRRLLFFAVSFLLRTCPANLLCPALVRRRFWHKLCSKNQQRPTLLIKKVFKKSYVSCIIPV
jgi:hypothetical protein